MTKRTTVLAMGIALSFSAASTAQIEVGKPFPDLRLPTLDGEVQSVSDFRGKKVILHVFASW